MEKNKNLLDEIRMEIVRNKNHKLLIGKMITEKIRK